MRKILLLMVILLTLASCSRQPRVVNISQMVEVGEPEIRSYNPITLEVPNCSGINQPVVARPSYKVSSSTAIEWQVGGSVGVGPSIGIPTIPLSVDISGEINTHLSQNTTNRVEKGFAWDLPAEPNSIVVYTFSWDEVWQEGNIRVTLSDKSAIVISVWYRKDFIIKLIDTLYLECDDKNETVDSEPSIQEITPIPQDEVKVSNASLWRENITQIPTIGTSIEWNIKKGEVFILSGGRLKLKDYFCGNDQNQICLLIIEVDEDFTVRINELIARNNWIGVTNQMSSQEALQEIEEWFWKPPNCGIGCSKATIAYFINDEFISQQILNK